MKVDPSGRPLTTDEAEHFIHRTRSITAHLAESDALDILRCCDSQENLMLPP
jgi:hypothetical protein